MKPSGLRFSGCAALAAALCIGFASSVALGETATVIDPTEGLEESKPAMQDAARKRTRAEKEQRRRAEAEQRKRAQAEARALAAKKLAAERESARLRAIEQAREAAAREAARKAAAAHAANVRAEAAKAAAARAAEVREAIREAAARELAARETAAKEAAAKEAAARAAAAREAADRLIAAREAAARENRLRLVASRATSMRDVPIQNERIGTTFRDCDKCPELVWLPQGEFAMGDASSAGARRPVVGIKYMLAVGRFEVTFNEWDACVAGGGCRRRPHDAGWGRGLQPVVNVSWLDAQQYVAWLSRTTNKRYRLLTEAEWEYAARAGTDVRYWWGDQAGRGDANCSDCGSKWDGRQAAPVGRFAPNPFGLHDMHGNVSEWVEDCYHDRTGERMQDAPVDGRAWTSGCTAAVDTRIVRGGAWHGSARTIRSASRTSAAADHSDNGIGFRIARTQ
jgi:formylglycine-generating enzyme required for sulfatase activity